jgi:uncharacterized repeat protein (TIGR03803 family)
MIVPAILALVSCAHSTTQDRGGVQFMPEVRSLERGERGTETVLFSFTGKRGNLPGANAASTLAVLEKGSETLFYGAAPKGGREKAGTIYSVRGVPGHFSAGAVWKFDGNDGASPYGVPLLSLSGEAIYATTQSGGLYDRGAVVRVLLSRNGENERVIHSFSGSDGGQPYAGLIFGPDGGLFGTTLVGGSSNDGTVFELRPHGDHYRFVSLYSFSGLSSGDFPYAPLVVGFDGHFFGTTIEGGTKNNGTVYELIGTRSITEKVLHSFTGHGDGAFPYAGVIADKAGNLYGTTTNGGLTNYGAVFELKRFGTRFKESVLHSFGAAGDGQYPYGPLTFGANGVMYGTTENGGAYGLGTVYALKPSSGTYVERVVHSFSGPPNDGELPVGGLTYLNGVLYGTTFGGGAANDGTIFSLKP